MDHIVKMFGLLASILSIVDFYRRWLLQRQNGSGNTDDEGTSDSRVNEPETEGT